MGFLQWIVAHTGWGHRPESPDVIHTAEGLEERERARTRSRRELQARAARVRRIMAAEFERDVQIRGHES